MSGLVFVGGIVTGNLWLNDGKKNSRNFRQGNRVYDSEGIATALSANSVGGLGGETSLYLVEENKRNEDENLEYLAIKGDLLTRRNPQRQNGISEEVMFTLRQAVTHGVIEVQTDTKENKRKEDETLTNKQTSIFEFMSEEKTVEKKPFKYISLFAGIGGFDFGLNAVGGECVFASEIDKFAKQAYTTLHGLEPHGDITEIDAKDVPDHDVLVGGFPCQAFSVAGKRGGFEDARGTLFFHMARIAKEKQPKVILAENVKGLVGHDKGKTLDTIVKTLNQIGYRVDFEVLNSKYFGVPQNRERIFIVAVREDLVENEEWSNVKGNTIVPKGKRRISGYDDVKTFNFEFPKNDTVNKRLVDVLEDEVDEKYYLSDERVKQLKFNDKVQKGDIKQVAQYDTDKRENSNRFRTYDVEGIGPGLSTMGGGGLEPCITVLGNTSKTGYGSHDVHGTNGMSPTLKTNSGGYSEPIITENSPAGSIKIVGNPSNTGHGNMDVHDPSGISPTITARDYKGAKLVVEGLPIPEASEASGVNQGVVERVEGIADRTRGGKKTLEPNGEEFANALTSVQHDSMALEKPRLRIRKLTPLECWRLQGFTDEQHNAVEASGISNSQRYKQAGNAVTVNVIEAIGERLIPYL